jgi:hypothetical protein
MRSKRALGIGLALAALAAGPAQAADELSETQRLQDRREVAAGTRAQVLGFQDGRFYANGWHITGEMGGIVTPPLKLLDSVSFGVNGDWIGPATRFTSGWGYTRYELPGLAGLRLSRTDFVPDGVRGALLGLKLSNPSHRKKTVTVMVDAHSELMTQYPWGFDPPPDRQPNTPHASDNVPDRGAVDSGTLVFRDTGRLPGETSDHSYTAIVGSDRQASRGEVGPGHYGPFGAGRRCSPTPPDEMPRECDDGPFGRGTGGQLRYRVKVKGHDAKTLWIAVAGSENSVGEARAAFARLTDDPERLLRRKRAARKALGRWSRVTLPGNPLLQESIDWGKQNLADLTQTATDLEIRWTNEGREWTFEGEVPEIGWVGAGFPDYPWLFGTDGEYTAHANVTLGQFESIKDHMRALRDVSEILSDGSGVVVHEVVADGSVWHGKDQRTVDPATGEVTYDFNTDEIVKFPGAVALIWRWTGDDGFRDEMLDFTRRNLEYVRTQLDADGDGWPEGNGNVERPGMGEEKLDNAVFYIRGLYDYADMARSAGQVAEANAAEARADELRARFDPTWWIPADQQYGDSLDENNVPINQKHWIGVDPMEIELLVDGEIVPGVAPYDHGSAALATRENNCYSGERPGNRGLFHTGCGGGPTGAGEFAIFSLGTGVMAVGEGNYGRLGTNEQRRYTDANAETQFEQPATGGTPDEQPGAMPEIFPSLPPPGGTGGTPPNIDRCWTCRSMFMQAWGHYGTAWPVVHQQLGVRPQLGHDRLDVIPQVPDGQPSVQGEDIRLGQGSADVLASHDGNRYTTVTDSDDVRLETFRIGHTLPRGATVASVVLDGAAVSDYDAVETNRGLEVSVEAAPGRRHTLVVTTG